MVLVCTAIKWLRNQQILNHFTCNKLYRVINCVVSSHSWNSSHVVVWSPLITPNFCSRSNMSTNDGYKCSSCPIMDQFRISYSRSWGCVHHPKYPLFLSWWAATTILEKMKDKCTKRFWTWSSVNTLICTIVPGPPNIIGACNSLVEQTSLIYWYMSIRNFCLLAW